MGSSGVAKDLVFRSLKKQICQSVSCKRMFTNGDPEAENPVEATTITAEFLNGIQEEICSLIES